MSRLRFDGAGAGLGKRLGGDANSMFDYTLLCVPACVNPQTGKTTELGPLGRYRADGLGRRSALCPICNHVSIVDDTGACHAYIHFDVINQLQKKTG